MIIRIKAMVSAKGILQRYSARLSGERINFVCVVKDGILSLEKKRMVAIP